MSKFELRCQRQRLKEEPRIVRQFGWHEIAELGNCPVNNNQDNTVSDASDGDNENSPSDGLSSCNDFGPF